MHRAAFRTNKLLIGTCYLQASNDVSCFYTISNPVRIDKVKLTGQNLAKFSALSMDVLFYTMKLHYYQKRPNLE